MAGYGALLGKAWDLGKQAVQVVAQTFGNPSTPFDVVEIQNSQLNSSFREDPTLGVHVVPGQLFRILLQTSGHMYHVICTLPGSAVSQSVFRSAKKDEVLSVCRRFESQKYLFTNVVARDKEQFAKLVEILHSHPEWHTIHCVSHMNCTQYFDKLSGDPNLKNLMHIPSNPEGKLPLHIACEQGNVGMIRKLLSLGADPSKVDPSQKNAIHYAACSSSSESVILELSKSPSFLSCLNAKNESGFSPLFLAIKNKKHEALAALLKAGASADEQCNGRLPLQETVDAGTDESSLRCVKALVSHCPKLVLQSDGDGDTPLHRTTNMETLEALLSGCSANVNVNVGNKAGQTPLHLFVLRGLLSCAVKFLAHGGDPNAQDKQGNTPLHLAAKNGSVDIVKALLVFGADTQVRNESGRSVSDMAAMCRDKTLMSAVQFCIQVHSGETALMESPTTHAFEDFAQALALSSAVKRKEDCVGTRMNLLCLDGGGIRGLVLIQILLHLELVLGCPIMDKFQWVGGTSTGGILAIALSLGRSLRDCQRLYFRFKDSVFRGMRPYNTEVLESFLKEEIGVEKTLADISSRRLTVTTVIADKQPVKLLLFRNYTLPLTEKENSSLGFTPPESQSLWKAARCSSAAPTYFSSVEGKYSDGGLVANNPTLDLLTEVQWNNTAANYVDRPDKVIDLGCVLSVGTGQTPSKTVSSESMNLGLPSGALDALMKAFAVRELGNLLIDQVTATDGRPVDRSRAWCTSLGIPYFRFSTELSMDVGLDEVNDEKLIRMLWETEIYMRHSRNHVQALIDFLKFEL